MQKGALFTRIVKYSSKEYHTISTGFCRLRDSGFFIGRAKNLVIQARMASNGATHHSSFAGHVKTIGTHDGKFHCDEVLACSMLKLLPEYKDAEIVR